MAEEVLSSLSQSELRRRIDQQAERLALLTSGSRHHDIASQILLMMRQMLEVGEAIQVLKVKPDGEG